MDSNTDPCYNISPNCNFNSEERRLFLDWVDTYDYALEKAYVPHADEIDANAENSDDECDDLMSEKNMLKVLARELTEKFSFNSYMKFRIELERMESERQNEGSDEEEEY